ncbi:chorion transcription factor Cf2-like [Leguminivora glycinivorella]|uniref:chorion transcription factor Cf2-like n=1 Tax=Leguminivora glycinivorella TaxID=1035111 RepID=UPI00200F4DFD|nr:chorion transcription factor Cf2-like [Leguminivora glycinivorella]
MEEYYSCSCCLVRPPEKGLKTLYNHHGKTEIYYDMLTECFGLNLSFGNEECGICEVCVGRLRDASDFKLQVQRVQGVLHARLKGSVPVTTADNIKVKIKLERLTGDDATSDHPLCPLGRSSSAPCSPVWDQAGEVGVKADTDIITVTLEEELPAPDAEPAPTASQSVPDAPAPSEAQRSSNTGDKPYSCNKCDKTFGQKGHLNAHYATHTGKFKFYCELCKRGFIHKHQYATHMRRHTGEKPYACDKCDKKFRQKGHFNDHYATHLGKFKFTCEFCVEPGEKLHAKKIRRIDKETRL